MVISSLALPGCKQFEENLREDQHEHSLSGIGEMQEQEVSDISDSGQLNEFEQEQMNEAISGQ